MNIFEVVEKLSLTEEDIIISKLRGEIIAHCLIQLAISAHNSKVHLDKASEITNKYL